MKSKLIILLISSIIIFYGAINIPTPTTANILLSEDWPDITASQPVKELNTLHPSNSTFSATFNTAYATSDLCVTSNCITSNPVLTSSPTQTPEILDNVQNFTSKPTAEPTTELTAKPTIKPTIKPTASPHKHQYAFINVEPSCTTDGKMIYKCNCGKLYFKIIPQIGHHYKCVETKESTVMEVGYTTYQCSRCNNTYTTKLPAVQGAVNTDMCGKSLWLQPLKHEKYYDFMSQVFTLLRQKVTYKDIHKYQIALPDDTNQLITDWFSSAYYYVAYHFSYAINTDKNSNESWIIWADELDYQTLDVISAECTRILKELNITSNTTQKEAIIRINEYLRTTRYYQYDKSKIDGSLYNSIFNEAAVCHNYAIAFQMLCLHAGIECYYYSSKTMTHAWNKVYFSDGTYYWVDPCWNDAKRPNRYLLITTEQLLKDHSL